MKRRGLVAVSVLSLAVAAAGCSRKSYKLPAGSMIPTFDVGAAVTADTSKKTPARGDIFVFKFPEHPEQSFVKRIVAIGGDRVETKGRVLSINGKAVPSCAIGRYSYEGDGTKHEAELVLENGGHPYLVIYDVGIGNPSDGAWTVPAGQFFAMGDNRNNSHDSRMWNAGVGGSVPPDLIEGKVEDPPIALPKGAEALAPKLAKCKSDLGVTP